MRYLSPEWMDAARRALADDSRLAETTREVHLTLDQVVEDGPGSEIHWHVVIDDGAVVLTEGPAERYDVRIATSYETAAQIATGRLAAQRAFVDGRLRVSGDLTTLVVHQRALGALDDALAQVRHATTFERP